RVCRQKIADAISTGLILMGNGKLCHRHQRKILVHLNVCESRDGRSTNARIPGAEDFPVWPCDSMKHSPVHHQCQRLKQAGTDLRLMFERGMAAERKRGQKLTGLPVEHTKPGVFILVLHSNGSNSIKSASDNLNRLDL